MDDTPRILKAKLLLSGVKMTLNSVAVKLEFAWQGFKDSDSRNLKGDAKGARESIVVRESHAGFDSDEKRMMIWAQAEEASVQGVGVAALGCTCMRCSGLGCAAARGRRRSCCYSEVMYLSMERYLIWNQERCKCRDGCWCERGGIGGCRCDDRNRNKEIERVAMLTGDNGCHVMTALIVPLV